MTNKYDPVIVARNATIAAARALVAFKSSAQDGRYPPQYVSQEVARLSAVVKAADLAQRAAFNTYRELATKAAFDLRAKAEAEVNPAKRLADIAEVQMLTSTTNGDALVAQAQRMLSAGQPERASMFIAAARAKGARVAHDLIVSVDDALDVSDSTRSDAREVEDALAASTATFNEERFQILAASIGITKDGDAGTNAAGERARSDMNAKMTAYVAATARGEAYSAPVGNGTAAE